MNEILPNYGQIAFYLRLSISDGDLDGKMESNSIENQRLLLREYVARLIEKSVDDCDEDSLGRLTNGYLQGVSEYVDDGYSGTNFDRPAFKRMIGDAKCGKINTIIVKDASRLGRDHIEVGDYLEQIFPLIGVRFIAVGSNYDSDRCQNTTMGLEMSIMNLVNAEYSKDLSRKIRSAKRALWNSGIPTSGTAPFGYVAVNKRYVPDPVTAPVVRTIFDLAIAGWSSAGIVDHLNARKIPTPAKFAEMRSGKPNTTCIVSDGERLWDTRKIHSLLRNYSYTGSMVHGKYRNLTVGGKSVRVAEKGEQVVIENSHEGIVTVGEWNAAQLAIRKIAKGSARAPAGFVLGGKIKCGNCGLAMSYSGKGEPVVFCGHAASAGRASGCCRVRHDARKIEGIVAQELCRRIRLLKYLGTKVEGQVPADTRRLRGQVEALKGEKIRLYIAYADGLADRGMYIEKRDEIAEKIAGLEEKISRIEERISERNRILREIRDAADVLDSPAENIAAERSLTRGAVEALVESVIIYDGENIEMNFSFDETGRKTVDYLGKIEL